MPEDQPRQADNPIRGTPEIPANQTVIKAKRSVIISLYVTMAIPIVAVVSFGIWLYADLYATSNRFQAEVANGSSENVPVEPDDFKRIDVRQGLSCNTIQLWIMTRMVLSEYGFTQAIN